MNSLNRRDALKSGLFGAAAAAGTMLGAGAAEAKPASQAKDYKFDFVVVGAGCAGLSAALEAADQGATVAVLEKMGMPFGNTIYAGGIFNATNTYVQKEQGLTDTVDAFYEDMMKVSQGRGDPQLTRVYADESAGAVQWLHDRVGINFKKIVKEVWPGLVRGHVVDGPKKPGGAQLITQLLEQVKKNPKIKFFTNTKVIELLKTPTLECTGVRAVSKTEGEVVFHAKGGVLMATGGFHANKEMVCKYMGGGVAWMPLRGSPYLMGENVELTRPFFPYYMNMDQFHGGPIHAQTQANPSTLVNYGVIVGTNGDRIINEAKTYVEMAKELPVITRNNLAYIVIDSAVLENDTVATRLDRYRAKKAPVYQADTYAELAKQMGGRPRSLYQDDGRLQRSREVREGRSPHTGQYAQGAAPGCQGSVPRASLLRRHDCHLRRPEDQRQRTGSQCRAATGSGAVRSRQCYRRTVLLELHRRLSADGRGYFRPPCRSGCGRPRQGKGCQEGLMHLRKMRSNG